MCSSDLNEILDQAHERGYARGGYDALCLAPKNDAPLSGEWAGESIPELLGDLLALLGDDEDDICSAYEEGYSLGYDECLIEEMFRMENMD